MKKTYINPEMTAVYTAQTLLNATSPQVSISTDESASIDAANVDVKGGTQSYDVWADDWSK